MVLVLAGSFILLFYTSALSKEGNLTCPETKFKKTSDITSDDVKAVKKEDSTLKTECFC